jgi:hypothetical protein
MVEVVVLKSAGVLEQAKLHTSRVSGRQQCASATTYRNSGRPWTAARIIKHAQLYAYIPSPVT